MSDFYKTRIGQQFLDGSVSAVTSISSSMQDIAKELTLIRALLEKTLPPEVPQSTSYVQLKEKLGKLP